MTQTLYAHMNNKRKKKYVVENNQRNNMGPKVELIVRVNQLLSVSIVKFSGHLILRTQNQTAWFLKS
jgi:hypothetical protein